MDGAEEHIRRAALDVTGSENEANALLSGDALNPESIRKLKLDSQAVLEAQKSLQGGRIAAGSRHTVGLQSDGTVVAVGDNTYGQTDVSSWSGVIQVAAGARHTVGLKSDGTVFATGDNSKGQLNVSDWTDIKMIACSDYDTLGLKNDGTVVTTGLHGYSDVADWHNVTSISGGSYSAACLYGQGMMLSTHKGAQMKTGVLLSQLSVCGPYAAGVQPDGHAGVLVGRRARVDGNRARRNLHHRASWPSQTPAKSERTSSAHRTIPASSSTARLSKSPPAARTT